MTSNGQSAAPAPAKRRASDTEPGSERAAKLVRTNWIKTIEVSVFSGHEDQLDFSGRQPFKVHEDLLFHHSPHIATKVVKEPKRDFIFICETDPAHFECYLSWIYTRAIDMRVEKSKPGDLLLRTGDQNKKVTEETAVILKLCSLLILNESELKDDSFKAELLSKLQERVSGNHEHWVLNALESDGSGRALNPLMRVEEMWALAGPQVWIKEWIAKWDAPGLKRQQIDQRSAAMDAELRRLLYKKARPMLTIQFGRSLCTLDRDMVFARCPILASGGQVTQTLQEHQQSLVIVWRRTFGLNNPEFFDMPSLAYHMEVTSQRNEFCELYAMAVYLGDSKLKRSILVYFIQLTASRSPPNIFNKFMFQSINSLFPSSGLRRWFVDYFAANATPGTWDSHHCSTELKTEVMNRLFAGRARPDVPKLADLDKYCKAG